MSKLHCVMFELFQFGIYGISLLHAGQVHCCPVLLIILMSYGGWLSIQNSKILLNSLKEKGQINIKINRENGSSEHL